ncbi:MAG: hypothetical protein RQ767_02890 [Thermovirgaceae bacterium]|nr:hypothetical protein [Thermovirgaceae bacterium]
MNLEEKLSEARKAPSSFTEEEKSRIRAFRESLAKPGVTQNVPGKGDPMPPFTLPDHNGKAVSSVDILKKGPFGLVFYRGSW